MKLITILFCFIYVMGQSQSDTAIPPEPELVSMNDTNVKYGGQYGQQYFEKGNDEPYTGFLCARYDNGELESVQQFVDGVCNGIWIDYDPDGRKRLQGTMVNNRTEGPVTLFYEDGSVKAKGEYMHWRKSIGWWTFYDRKGNVVSKRRFTR